MPLFVAIGLDHPPHSMELRDKFRDAHRAYGSSNDQTTRLAGAFYTSDGNQCGTMKIFEADSAEEVWEWYRHDPFFTNNVYASFQVLEWRLAYNQFEKKDWDLTAPAKV